MSLVLRYKHPLRSGIGLVLVGWLAAVPASGAEVFWVAQAEVRPMVQKGSPVQQLIDEGMQLFQQGSQKSLQEALVKLTEAIRLSQAANDKSQMALALLLTGRISDLLGEKAKSLIDYEQSLALFQAVGDRLKQASVLNNIGLIYDSFGEKQKALHYYHESLALSHSFDDQSEAATLINIGFVNAALGKHNKALEFYNQSLALARKIGDYNIEATALNNIGMSYSALGKKQQALDYYNQSLPLVRFAKNYFTEARVVGNIGVIYSEWGEKRKALELYQYSLDLTRKTGDRNGEATLLDNIGMIHSALGDNQTALEHLNQSLSLSQKLRDRTQEVAALTNLGLVYTAIGEKQKALDYYTQALPLNQNLGNPIGYATILHNIGGVYLDLGELQKALDFFDQSLRVSRSVKDVSGEARSLNAIAGVYSVLGGQQKALTSYDQALDLARAVGDRVLEATVISNMGGSHSALGDMQKALELFNQALPIRRAVGDRAGEASTLAHMAAIYKDLGERQKALELFNQSLGLSRAILDRNGEAAALGNIGAVYSDLGETQKALDYYSQSLPIRRAVGDRVGEAATLNNIGGTYGDLGDVKKALEFHQQSLLLSREVGDRNQEAMTLNNIGVAYHMINETQNALKSYEQSSVLHRDVGNSTGLALALFNISYLYRSQNRLPEALSQINTAIALIEQLRSTYTDPQLKTSYFTTVQDYYQFKINLLMQLHQQNPTGDHAAQAFQTSDQQRARVLRDLLTESNANITQNVDPALASQERDLQTKLAAREKLLITLSSQPTTQPAIARTQQEIQALLQQQQSLAAEIRRTNPEYAKLQYPEPISLSEVQQQLDNDTLLLQYSLGKDASYLWVIGKTSFHTYPLPPKAELETTIAAFRDAIQRLSQNGTRLFSPAQTLTEKILAPAAPLLGSKRLVIVADGALNTIPFAALTQPGSSQYQPLIMNHTISYLPSAALVTPFYPHRKPAPKTIAILADPIFNLKDERLDSVAKSSSTTPSNLSSSSDLKEALARSSTARSLSFNRLPGTAKEAQTILKLVPNANQSAAVFGFDSNYNWVTTYPLKQYRYILLATHGFFDAVRPELSSVILSLYNRQGQPQDRAFLRLPEMFNLDFPAEMVTLSACETGLGSSIPGEGLVGMTRGLMYAGAKRVTVSLWNVPDPETAELMSLFHGKILQRGQFQKDQLPKNVTITHPEALAEVQRQMWQAGKHPYYWSAFVMQGEWRN